MIKLDKLEQKKKLDFYMLCKTFQNTGIHSEEEALKCKAKLLSNAKIQVLVVLIIGSSLALMFTQPAIILFTLIAMIYIVVFTYRGRVYIQRYIDEILKHPDYDPNVALAEQMKHNGENSII
jgi:hypothetical protein